MSIRTDYSAVFNKKNSIIDGALLTGTILGFIAFFFSLGGYYESDFKMGFLFDLLIVTSFLIMYIVRKRVSLPFKVYGSLLCIFLITIADIYRYGIFSDNKILFILIPLISYVIFSYKEAIILSGISLMGYLILGFLFNSNILTPQCDYNIRANEIFVWAINIVLISILSIIVIIIIKHYNKALLALIIRLKSQNKDLQEYKDKLEEMVENKTQELKATNIELKETIKNLQATQSQLIMAEKMASISVLTAGIAHEINNPLNYILAGYTGIEDYIESNKISSKTVNDSMTHIKSGVDKASAIIKDLDYFNEYSNLMDENCDINKIINNCLSVLNFKIENRITVIKNFSLSPLVMKGNCSNLHQVFTNIILNSIQAINNTGTINISTKAVNNDIFIEIKDTGIGIHEDYIDRITEPFYTTKAPGQGVGLGLSVVYSIIKKHNGIITFESPENKGTTVKIKLPFSIN